MSEAISIVIKDGIEPAISATLKEIAEQAVATNQSILKLQAALNSTSSYSSLQKLQTELARTELAQQKLSTEVNKTNATYFNSETALNKAIAAETKAAIVSEQLAKVQANAALAAQRLEAQRVSAAESASAKLIALQRNSIAKEESLEAQRVRVAQLADEKIAASALAAQQQRIKLQRASIATEERLEKQRQTELARIRFGSASSLGSASIFENFGAGFIGGFTKTFNPELLGMAAALGTVAAAVKGFHAAISDALDMQTFIQTLNFATGSAKDGAEALGFLEEQARTLGVSLRASAPEFALMAAAAKETSLEGKGVRDIFKSMSEAAVTLHLNADSTSRGFYALREMIESTTIQTRQMRMLAIAIPGSFQDMTKAAGTTTEGLMKMMKAGQLLTEDMIPKFAAIMHDKYGPAAVDASNNARQSMQKFKNEVFLTSAEIGGPLMDKLGEVAGIAAKILAYGRESRAAFNGNDLPKGPDDWTGSSHNASDWTGSVGHAKPDTQKQIEGALELQDKIDAARFDLIQDNVKKELALEKYRYDKQIAIAGQSQKELELQLTLHKLKMAAIENKPTVNKDEVLKNEKLKLNDELSRMFVLPQDRANQEALDKITESLSKGKEKIKLNETETKTILDNIKAVQAATVVQKQFDSIYNEFAGPALNFNATIEAGSKLLQQGAITAEQYQRVVAKASEAFSNSQDPLRQYNKDLNDQFYLLGFVSKRQEIETQLLQEKNKLIVQGYDVDSKAISLKLASLRERLEALQAEKEINQDLNKIYGETLGAQSSLELQTIALNQAYSKGYLTTEDYTNRLVKLRIELANLKLQMGEGAFTDVLTSSIGQLVSSYKSALSEMSGALGNFFQSFEDGFANSIGRAIVFSENFGDAMKSVAKEAVAALISSLVKLGIQMVITETLGTGVATTALATQTALSAAAAASTALAWATPAALVSLASFGANSAPASAGIVATNALSEGLALSSIAGYANGTDFAPGGMAWVGEKGPELLNIPRGSQVYTAQESRRMSAGGYTHNGDIVVSVAVPKGSTKAENEAVGASVADGLMKQMRKLRQIDKQATFNGVL